MADAESVARLLHSKIVEPDKAAFTRKELMGEFDNPNNVCGQSDGCSVDRIDGLSDDEIRARSHTQAALKPDRKSRGALIVSVAALRSIRHPDAPMGKAVYVYDDPRGDNDRHVVIRISAAVPRTDFTEVRAALMSIFDRRVA